ELLGDSTAEAGRKKRVVQQVPAKYQFEVNGEMQYWTGRGRKPKAIEEALAAGKKLDDFLIPDSEK
ncbi:DNA-binding protein, partial [Salmonella enterica]|nr:DNA-binding protein [Salmonella enterica]